MRHVAAVDVGGMLVTGLHEEREELDPDCRKAGPSPRSTPRPSEDALAAATAQGLTDVSILTACRNAAGTMEYLVSTTDAYGKMVAVRHRYSDFISLHAALRPILADNLPALPPSPTPWLKVRAVHEKRQQMLVDYLRRTYACQPEPPHVLLQFFGLEPAKDESHTSKDTEGRSTRSTALATWGDLREDYLMAMATEDEDEAWRVGTTVDSLMEAMLGVDHPLGTLRHSLLELFEVRLAVGRQLGGTRQVSCWLAAIVASGLHTRGRSAMRALARSHCTLVLLAWLVAP